MQMQPTASQVREKNTEVHQLKLNQKVAPNMKNAGEVMHVKNHQNEAHELRLNEKLAPDVESAQSQTRDKESR